MNRLNVKSTLEMIYIWHNTTTGRYEFGDESSYTLEKAMHDVTLLYDFTEKESAMAEKILINLNRAAQSFEKEFA